MRRLKLLGPRAHGIISKSFCVSIIAVCLLSILSFAQQSSPPVPDANHPGWVVISVDEYQDLRAHAFPTDRLPEPPPVDATLSRVDYDLRIAGSLATGRATLTVDVLKDGWVRVPVPSGLLVREARLDGKLVSLVSGGAGKSNALSAVLAHAGRAVLLLDIALPVNASAGEERIALPSTSSGVTRASVQLPRPDLDVKLSGGLLADKSANGTESKWLAYARGNEPLMFTWRRKMEDHHVTLPLRQRGSLTQLTSLGEDTTSVYAEANVEVLQGAAREARIRLPEGMTINQVSGAMVADWEAKPGELLVTFLEPVEQSARFVITGETRTAREGHIDISLLHLLNTERETGGVAVEVLGAGEVKDLKSQGLENVDATELGEYVAGRQSPSMVAFRFRSGDSSTLRALSVDIARYTQQAVLMANVEEARYRVLLTKEGKMLVQAQYAIRNNQRNFLKINLPTDAVVWSASLAGKPVRPGQATDGSLLLPLEKTRAGEDTPAFILELFYLVRETAWSDKGKATLALPALDLSVARTGLLLYHPPRFKVTGEPGTFRVESYEAPVSDAFRPLVVDVGTGARIDLDRRSAHDRVQSFQSLNGPPQAQPQSATQTLVDNYKAKSLGGRGAKVLPIRPAFPAFGPSLFFVSELTAENHVPALQLNYQREKKEGSR